MPCQRAGRNPILFDFWSRARRRPTRRPPLGTRAAAVGCFIGRLYPKASAGSILFLYQTVFSRQQKSGSQNRSARNPGHAEAWCRSAHESQPLAVLLAASTPKPRWRRPILQTKNYFIPRANGNPVQKRKLLLNDFLLQLSRAEAWCRSALKPQPLAVSLAASTPKPPLVPSFSYTKLCFRISKKSGSQNRARRSHPGRRPGAARHSNRSRWLFFWQPLPQSPAGSDPNECCL